MYKTIEKIISEILYYPILSYFILFRFLKDHSFRYSLKSKKIKYNYISFFSWFLLNMIKRLVKIISYTYSNICVSKYTTYNKIHYSKKGRGYFDYQNLNYAQKEKIYSLNISRLEILLNHYSSLKLRFSNNDTFIDLGCGKGENIKYLLKNFPNSKITGVDISNEALKLIRASEKSQNLFLKPIDLTNLKNIQNIKSKRYDNIIISYVLSTLLKDDIVKTTLFRSNLIKECLRISKKNIIILDHESMFCGIEKSFMIEQENRGFYHENIFNLNSIKQCTKEKFLIRHDFINALIINNE